MLSTKFVLPPGEPREPFVFSSVLRLTARMHDSCIEFPTGIELTYVRIGDLWTLMWVLLAPLRNLPNPAQTGTTRWPASMVLLSMTLAAVFCRSCELFFLSNHVQECACWIWIRDRHPGIEVAYLIQVENGSARTCLGHKWSDSWAKEPRPPPPSPTPKYWRPYGKTWIYY